MAAIQGTFLGSGAFINVYKINKYVRRRRLMVVGYLIGYAIGYTIVYSVKIICSIIELFITALVLNAKTCVRIWGYSHQSKEFIKRSNL
jgi:hypothetical protein